MDDLWIPEAPELLRITLERGDRTIERAAIALALFFGSAAPEWAYEIVGAWLAEGA